MRPLKAGTPQLNRAWQPPATSTLQQYVNSGWSGPTVRERGPSSHVVAARGGAAPPVAGRGDGSSLTSRHDGAQICRQPVAGLIAVHASGLD